MQLIVDNEKPRIEEVYNEYGDLIGYAVTCWDSTLIYHSGNPDEDKASAEAYLDALGEIE